MKTRLELNKNAVELRRKFGFNSYNPVDLMNIVLDELPDVTIIFQPISDKTSGICINDEDIQIICINSKMDLARQRFTLAHELYHMLIEKNFKIFLCSDNNKNESEIEADIFASFLLMPDEALKKYLNKNNMKKLDLTSIIKLEQYFQIGHQEMLIRLKQDNYITKKELQEYKQANIVSEAARIGFSTELYDFPLKNEYKVIGKYIKLINELSSNKAITSGEKQELLRNAYREDLVYNG